MDLGIKGRTALVTAASRGIGNATARTLAKEGVNIVMCARGQAELDSAAEAIRAETGVRVVAQAADVTQSADVARSVREPIPALTVSNATRPGAAGLMKSLSQEVARDGILLNTILPGRIMTERFRQGADHSALSRDEYMKKQSAELPVGRFGEAQEIADAVAFLASERASYINGVSLPVDGGLIRSI